MRRALCPARTTSDSTAYEPGASSCFIHIVPSAGVSNPSYRLVGAGTLVGELLGAWVVAAGVIWPPDAGPPKDKQARNPQTKRQ